MPLTLLLHGKHAGPTTTYEPFGEWVVPWRFRAFDEEYRALRTGAGLIDYSTQAALTCQGANRVDFLQRLLTNDLTQLVPGTGCPAALLTPSAKLIADLLVVADPDALWLLCDLPRAKTVAESLDRYLFSEQVTVVNHERQKAVLAVQGPRTMDLLTQITGTAIADTSKVNSAVKRIKSHTDLPICVGFGVKTADHARAIGATADGVVVGTAIVNVMADAIKAGKSAGETADAVKALVGDLARGVRESRLATAK